MTNPILEYNEKIHSGEIVAGKFILTIYTILVSGLENGIYFYNEKKANLAIMFIERFCRHSEGRTDLIKLELWQKAMTAAIFGIMDKDGLRMFREVLVVIGRKNGKSLFASALIACVAYTDGEYGANIYCLATKLEQAGKVYDGFYQIVKQEKALAGKAKKRRSDIYIGQSNTMIRPLAFSAKKMDGLNPHMVVNDEVASWRGAAGLRQYEAMKSALGARKQPLMLSISTAGYENDSAYDELVTRATDFLRGNSDEKRFLPFLYVIDDDSLWDNLDELKKSNPNMGVSVSEDYFVEEIKIAKKSPSKKAEFLTKYCNVKQNSSVAWLDYSVVERACTDEITLDYFNGCYAVGGIDLSQTTDLTAASVVIERDEMLYTFCRFFMPAERLEKAIADDGVPYDIFVRKGILTLSGENHVNYKDVLKWFVDLRQQQRILTMKIGYDRNSAQYLVDDLNFSGFQTDDVWQGENLASVMREAEGMLKDGHLRIVNNNLLKAHFLNVALKHNIETRRFRPVKIEQRMRIDGFVSVICALTMRSKYMNEIGAYLKNQAR